jgi:hypothetical protein
MQSVTEGHKPESLDGQSKRTGVRKEGMCVIRIILLPPLDEFPIVPLLEPLWGGVLDQVLMRGHHSLDITAMFPLPPKFIDPIPARISGTPHGFAGRWRMRGIAQAGRGVPAPRPPTHDENIDPELLPGLDHVALGDDANQFGVDGVEKKRYPVRFLVVDRREHALSRIHGVPPLIKSHRAKGIEHGAWSIEQKTKISFSIIYKASC